jgi:hypothetical protein
MKDNPNNKQFLEIEIGLNYQRIGVLKGCNCSLMSGGFVDDINVLLV